MFSGRGSFQWMFFVGGWPNLGDPLFRGSSEIREIEAGMRQAQPPVGPATYNVGIVCVLTVVFPKAHRTDLVSAPLIQSEVATARTAVRTAADWPSHAENELLP
jgi:hypothetical protein